MNNNAYTRSFIRTRKAVERNRRTGWNGTDRRSVRSLIRSNKVHLRVVSSVLRRIHGELRSRKYSTWHTLLKRAKASFYPFSTPSLPSLSSPLFFFPPLSLLLLLLILPSPQFSLLTNISRAFAFVGTFLQRVLALFIHLAYFPIKYLIL